MPTLLKNLTPLELQALKVIAKEADKVRAAVLPGQLQDVDVRLRIRGTVDVGEDEEVGDRFEDARLEQIPFDEMEISQRAKTDAELFLARIGRKAPEFRRGAVRGHLVVSEVMHGKQAQAA